MSGNPTRPKPRVGFVKSRTGCNVCKIRRIKCDETKPSCNRCTSSGRVCEGYMINRKPSPAPKVSYVLVPKPSRPGSPLSREDQEQQSLQLFFDKTALRITRWLGATFWERVVFKTAQSEPSIRCLVLAIGALDTPKLPGNLANQGDVSYDTHEYHLLGLQHYELAIKILRESASHGQADTRITLIASILIIFFESIHGAHDSALMQFHTGLEVIRNSSNKELCERIDRSEFPSSEPVEDEILHAFRHLHLQISFRELFRWSLKPPIITPEYLYPKLIIPTSMLEPEEARLRLEYIVGAALDFIASLNLYCHAREKDTTTYSGDIWPHYSLAPLEQFPPAVFSRQNELLAGLKEWHEVFEPFYQYTRTSGGKNFYSFASALESLYLAAYISTASTFFEKQTDFDAFIPHFTSIINMCDVILNRPSHFDQAQSGEFSLDLHVICPLILAGLKCRDPMLRRRAISLITSPKRTIQGLLPAPLLEKILLWIMSVEEDGIEGNFVTEESRGWVYRMIMVGPGKKKAKVQYQLFLKGFPQKSKAGSCIRETMVEW